MEWNPAPTAFTRTLRSLGADDFGASFTVLIVAVSLLIAWSLWFWCARVSRFETSDSARLEVGRAINPIQAPYTGKVVASHLRLGAQVHEQDVLLELDANPERLQLHEEQAHLVALDPQIKALRAQLAATVEARQREQEASVTALREAQARIREAEASARFATNDVDRYRRLRDLGVASEREYDRAQSEANSSQANVEALRQTAARLEQDRRTRESDRNANIRSIETAISHLEGEQISTKAALNRLQYEVEKRYIRAPVAGRLGAVANLQPGAVLHEGDLVGTIVPLGTLKIVAEFPPAAALGRIRPGQPARLRLKGFPWSQYGSIGARVTTVANEIQDGSVRVECNLLSETLALIPEEHGLPGSIEIEVERTSPATILFRAAGEMITAPRFESAPR